MRSTHRSPLALVFVSSLVLGAAACAQQKPEPQVASSAGQADYALEFPGELDNTTGYLGGHQDELKTILGRLDADVDGVKDPKSYPVALQVIDEADASGQSQAYVDRTHELEGVSGFFDAEGNAISQRVAGAAIYEAKQKSCDANVGGAAAGAIKPAVAKSIEKRLRDRNQAFATIERAKTSLSRADVAALEKLADDVARASYLVNIALVDNVNRIRRMASEGAKVKKTLDADIADEKAWQAEPGRSDADKKASNDRIDAANKAKAQVDASVQKALDMDNPKGALDKVVKDAQTQYNDAIAAQKKKLKQKVKG